MDVKRPRSSETVWIGYRQHNSQAKAIKDRGMNYNRIKMGKKRTSDEKKMLGKEKP